MLDDFGRVLVEAITHSSEFSGAVQRIRAEGFSLYLVLNCQEDGERRARMELTSQPARPVCEPVFRLNSEDLSFLKSVGIDPTRCPRRRRKGESASGGPASGGPASGGPASGGHA